MESFGELSYLHLRDRWMIRQLPARHG